MNETLRFALAALFLGLGVGVMLLAILGTCRFRFVMNRLQCAAVVDTLGMFLIVVGLLFASGSLDYAPKLVLLLGLLWLGSPVASRLVSRLELSTDEDAEKHMEREDRT